MEPTNNEILNGLNADDPRDPLGLADYPDELRQAAVRDAIVFASENLSTAYATLPLYIESFLLAVISDMYQQDETFPYVPGDEMASRIMITSAWNRFTNESRDRRPAIVVAFQNAGASEIWLRNMHLMTTPQFPMAEKKGLWETLQFRISVLHHNRSLALFLGQQVRAQIAQVMEILRATFKLQKVYPPSIMGPGQLEEYDDLYGAFVDFRVEAVPTWRVLADSMYIRRIVVETIGTAQRLMEGAIVQEIDTIVTTEGTTP